jgi:hypothetical protein
MYLVYSSLISWISYTRSQRCTDLQSLVVCLAHGDSMVQCAVIQGCVGLRDALKCISEALFTVMISTTWNQKLLSNICTV